MAEKLPVMGEKRMIADLVFDMMKIPAKDVDAIIMTLAQTGKVNKFAELIANSGVCVAYPAEWGDFDPLSAAAWANLPWIVLMRAQNDFLWAVKNFFES